MSCNLLYKILVIGVLFLFAFGAIFPSVNVVSKEIETQETIDNQDEKVVTCYFFDKKGKNQQEVVLSSEDYENFYSMFKELNHQVTYNPYSIETKDLKEDFIDLINSLGMIAEGFSKDDVILLMDQPIGRRRSLFSLLPNPISNGRGSAFFCNFATWGEGSQFPIIILPRLIPILLIPIPRVIMRWNANYGITSCGGLLSGKGFIAEGAQTGTALGFWGIGFSVFLPPVMSFGFIGYALYATATAENIIPWPPNNPPVVSGETPADGSIDVTLSLSELRFQISDLDGDTMNYSITTTPYIGGGSGNNVKDGTYSVPVSNLDSNTKYSWHVIVSDGEDTTEKTYYFRTEIEPPFVSDPSPFDGDDWVSVDISELSFRLEDFQSDPMDFTVETAPDIGSSSGSGVGNGIYSVPIGGLDYTTDYTWFVNVTDGKFWTRKIFVFKTQPVMVFNPFDIGWQFRKMITINHSQVSGDLVDFPVLISLTDVDLRDKAQVDGDDILFMDGEGVAVRLLHEIELFDGSSGELVAWVNVSNLSSSEDSVLYLYYGNSGCDSQNYPNMVWDLNYQAVWHFSEDGLGLRYDSTCNHYDAIPYNYEGDEAVLGQIYGADDFDGINDHLRTGVSFDYDYRTISFWVNSDVKPQSYPNVILSQDADELKYGLFYANIQSDGLHAKAGGEGKGGDFIFDININTWYMVQLVRDHQITKYYVNGDLVDTGDSGDAGSSWDANPNLVIGASRCYDRLFDGIIDEVRVSNIARSSDWILTEYNNQNNPSGFFNIGQEESGP